MQKGSIILVQFPFTDYSSSKLRPALVISTENKEDVCVAFISSVIPPQLSDTDFFLSQNNPEFKLTGLKVDSIIKLRKVATLDLDIIVGVIGNVSPKIQRDIDKKIKIAFGLEKA